jgi:hypothetical protein
MKTFTKIRDLDRMILLKLNDLSLRNVRYSSKYLNNLCDENFWKDRCAKYFLNKIQLKLSEDTWYNFYIKLLHLKRREKKLEVSELEMKNFYRMKIILQLMKDEEKSEEHPTVHFSGNHNFRMSLTKFDALSNNFVIAIATKDEYSAVIGLRILRYLIDEKFSTFQFDSENAVVDETSVEYEMANMEYEYYRQISETDIIFRTFGKSLKDVDIWTLKDLYYHFV